MTKEEFIEMRKKGQYSLPFFYQYYTENIHKAKFDRVIPFDEFGTAFQFWWGHRHDKESVIKLCEEYFSNKFGIIDITNPS